MLRECIIYACPRGELNTQLEAYFTTTLRKWGENSAHQYMPHCTLTGFFHDQFTSIPVYIESLNTALNDHLCHCPTEPIVVVDFQFKPQFHYLELASEWIKNVILDFADLAVSPTRVDALRCKTNLHLSLAYDFPPEQDQDLKRIAQTMINPQAEVSWELRFYERHGDQSWSCHHSWLLGRSREML